MMSPDECRAGAEALLKIQAKCRQWGEILRQNGWDTNKMAAAKTPEAKAMEATVMGLVKKHEELLTYCRSRFVPDPSTPLDRAFDYIGIYLGRGPEALEHTDGLPACLTVEVSSPEIAEPYREPTFLVQLGRWARRLAEMAEERDVDGDPVARAGRRQVNLPEPDGDEVQEAMPPQEDMAFFRQIADDIKSRPEFYREAGEWLDENFSNEAFQRREQARWEELLRKEEACELSPEERRFLENQRSKPPAETERARTSFLPLRRFNDAIRPYLKRPRAFPTVRDAKRILLMTWLLTEPEAEESGLGLTGFEHLLWEPGPNEPEEASRECVSDWLRFPSEEYSIWGALARRAWERVKPIGTVLPAAVREDSGEAGGPTGDSLLNQAKIVESVAKALRDLYAQVAGKTLEQITRSDKEKEATRRTLALVATHARLLRRLLNELGCHPHIRPKIESLLDLVTGVSQGEEMGGYWSSAREYAGPHLWEGKQLSVPGEFGKWAGELQAKAGGADGFSLLAGEVQVPPAVGDWRGPLSKAQWAKLLFPGRRGVRWRDVEARLPRIEIRAADPGSDHPCSWFVNADGLPAEYASRVRKRPRIEES